MSGPATRIDRLLIANRGEIAVRVARTATRLGIETVGIHSDADATALHVGAVDRSVALGGATPATSYLRADAVLDAALATGCDAVHPGYGFLAENAAFARAVVQAGLIWVGPTPEQIELLGDKIAAKAAAVRAGVPTTAVITVDDAAGAGGPAVPDGVIYPALVKAAAGGGGRGMRVVTRAEDLPAALDAARREALAAFGDDTVFIEPFIERGRHVEVQIFGDRHGDVVHLGDRDCSVQRRNQKVVEEAPAPGLSDDLRARLLDGAVALAREVGYLNAGTVEFLISSDGAGSDGNSAGDTITFLEVNTRLQVEHPVTEAVTGLDLVEWQLRIAQGESLPQRQDQIALDGHAIEVRLVAEDPASGWLPSTGTVEAFAVPDGVRCDTGVATGSDVGADYDSLLAKVIAHGPDRRSAVRVLAAALRRSSVVGPRTNLAASVALLEHPDFADGTPTTAFLDEHPELATARSLDGDDRVASLVAAVLHDEATARAADRRWGFAPSAWRNLAVHGTRSAWLDEHGERHDVEVLPPAGGSAEGSVVLVGAPPAVTEDGSLGPDGRRVVRARRVLQVDPTTTRLELDGVTTTWRVERLGDLAVTRGSAGTTTWQPLPHFEDHDAAATGSGPVAPLPGTVVSVHVSIDDTVGDGDVLVVVEAMKMEHTVRSATAGRVAEVRVAPGDRVDAGELLVVIRGDDADPPT